MITAKTSTSLLEIYAINPTCSNIYILFVIYVAHNIDVHRISQIYEKSYFHKMSFQSILYGLNGQVGLSTISHKD